MKALFLSQYYSPEINAPAHRMSFFAKHLSKKGDDVTVICEPPNYPERELFEGYENKWRSINQEDGVRVVRSWVHITKKKSFIPRILNYASYLLSSFFAGLHEDPDVIFVTSPPFPALASAWLLSKIKRVPLILDIRDIWPDSAVSVGMMKKGLLFKFLQWWEKKFYRSAEKIVVNAKGIGKRLTKEKEVPEEKIEFLPNGAEISMFDPEADGKELNKEFNIEAKFLVLFTGLIGLAQDPGVIVEAAKILKDERDITFLIVGDGPKRKECLELIDKYDLENIIMPGSYPREEMPKFVARADACLATHKKDDLFKDVIPSKIFDYMAGARPVIINSQGEGARIIKEAECGINIKPGSPQEMADAILRFYHNYDMARDYGKNGRGYAEEHFAKKKIAEKLRNLLQEVAS
ncbi:MAG TPA: glycosyltransferase family 4 protein [Candidatus Paceibacterota bacterium]|nr:glycosyltransferase family 4 protein [Candidatus Paceibacterota bacterium]